MYTKLIGILILGSVSFSMCENWALLVAGSNGWYNYRHQADVCHSYQMLHKKGFPDDHIVVMMYDDIASDSSNPTPGQIINYPNGPDVYKGVPKDYTKKDVNPMNFLNVLSGNAEAMKGIGSGKVIASGPNDKIFVFFSDHGATNLIAFPNDYLYADDLIKTLTAMYNNKQYKELVFYLEACESGSMFNGLLQSNMNIYTTTAANPCQSSYACYYDENRQTYLGDCYSVNWMIDTEHHNENKETFEQQYLTIKKETNMSQVCQYGQLSMSSETLSNFLENSQTTKSRSTLVTRPFIGEHSAVDQRDVELSILTHRLRVEKEHNIDIIQSEIREILESRRKYDNLFHTMALKLIGNEYPDILVLTEKNGKFEDGECKKCEEYIPTINMDCLKDAIRGIESSCGKFTHYGLGYTKWISRMCNLGIEADEIYNIATEYCI